MRVVILVPGGLVEVLQATPLLRTLRAGAPGMHITLACAPGMGEIVEHLPGIDAAIEVGALQPGAGPTSAARAWLNLRRRRFDAAVLCGRLVSHRLLIYGAGMARRIGPGGGLSAALLSDRVIVPRGENCAATWLRLASALGIEHMLHEPSFEPGTEARERARELILGSNTADGRLVVAMAPGSGGGEDGWEPERYAHLANQLGGRHAATVILLGSAADRPAVDRTRIDIQAPVLDLCGELDTAATAAVLAHCDLLVGTDSPLLHLAAAMGTPVVGLFGTTDGRSRGPYGAEHRVVQAVGRQAALDRIRVEDVLAGIEAAI